MAKMNHTLELKCDRQITNIEWDTDGEYIPELPTEVLVPKKWDDEEVTNWLSDTFGFCVFGWEG